MRQRSELRGQRIALIFKIEFDRLGRIYGCAPRRPGIPFCKRQGRGLKQENSANLSVDVTGHPKAFYIAADEKRRDRLADNAGVERLKLRGDRAMAASSRI